MYLGSLWRMKAYTQDVPVNVGNCSPSKIPVSNNRLKMSNCKVGEKFWQNLHFEFDSACV